MIKSLQINTQAYVIKNNEIPSSVAVLYKGNFISVLLKGKSEEISATELLHQRLILKAGGRAFISFDYTSWSNIQRELDGFASSNYWLHIPNERYLDNAYAKKFSIDLERENGHLSLAKMPLFKEEELLGVTNHLPPGFIPM